MSLKVGTIYLDKKTSGSLDEAKGTLVSESFSKLDELERRANLIVYEASSVWPLFSRNHDKITICINRVAITKRSRFSSEEYPMAIENITTARVFQHFTSASLELDTFGVAKPDALTGLRVNDARLARRYILALIECRKANIDLFGLDIDDLRERLKKIGMVRFSAGESQYHKL